LLTFSCFLRRIIGATLTRRFPSVCFRRVVVGINQAYGVALFIEFHHARDKYLHGDWRTIDVRQPSTISIGIRDPAYLQMKKEKAISVECIIHSGWHCRNGQGTVSRRQCASTAGIRFNGAWSGTAQGVE
jgi:hypothetical protein